MGEDRNVPLTERETKTIDFSRPDIDRFYLCGCSPYTTLAGTKSEAMLPVLAQPLKQDVKLKEAWDALEQRERDKYGFEHELFVFLRDLVEENDRRIQSTKARLEAQWDPSEAEMPPETAAVLSNLNDQITELQVKAEVAGESGDIDESVKLNESAEALIRRKQEIESAAELRKQDFAAKRQVVCEISGLIHAANDNEQRLAELHSGRQWKGWKAIRDKYAELLEKRPPRGDPKYARTANFSRVVRERPAGLDREREYRGRDYDRHYQAIDRNDRGERRSRY